MNTPPSSILGSPDVLLPPPGVPVPSPVQAAPDPTLEVLHDGQALTQEGRDRLVSVNACVNFTPQDGQIVARLLDQVGNIITAAAGPDRNAALHAALGAFRSRLP